MEKFAILVFLIFLVSLTHYSNASAVKILEPIQQVISNGNANAVNLGMVGPGQKVDIEVSNDTFVKTVIGSNYSIAGDYNWDIVKVNESTLSSGWVGQNSGLYENPLKAYVIIGPNASDGNYEFSFQAVNNYGDVAPQTIFATATVSRNVFSLSIVNDPVKVYLGSSADYQVKLTNSGNADDVFTLTASGITGVQPFSTQVFVAKQSSVLVPVSMFPKEPGTYPIDFYAQSLSSSSINSTATTTLFAGSDLLTDAKASARGFLLFPWSESYVYSIWAAIGSLLK